MGLKSTSSPWKCSTLLKLIGRVFLGVEALLNRQIFMEPGILTIPAYSLGVLIEAQFATSALNRGAGKNRRISRGKKKHASDWNGTSFASDSLVGKDAEFGVVDVLKGILIPGFFTKNLEIQLGSISLPLYPQELAFWSLNWVIWKPGLKRNSMSGWSQGQSG